MGAGMQLTFTFTNNGERTLVLASGTVEVCDGLDRCSELLGAFPRAPNLVSGGKVQTEFLSAGTIADLVSLDSSFWRARACLDEVMYADGSRETFD